MATSIVQELLGREVSGYRIERKLGQGGMGCVFQALHIPLDRPVALKVLPATVAGDEELIARFKTEAKAVARLEHDHIVEVYDQGELEGGYYFIAMELCQGGSVASRMKREGPFREREAVRIVREAALGLLAASKVGVTHRDMKPDNLLFAGMKDVVKIADFGLAKAADTRSGLTKTGTVMGTPAYMPPEQWEDARACDHRSDLYSLGCSFYELLAGKPPFQGPSAPNFMRQHLSDSIPDVRLVRPDVSGETAAAVALLMAKLPGDRYRSATDLVAALDLVLPETKTTPPTVRRPSERLNASVSASLSAGTRVLSELGSELGRTAPSRAPAPLASTLNVGPSAGPVVRPEVPRAQGLDVWGKALLLVFVLLGLLGLAQWVRKNVDLGGSGRPLELRCQTSLDDDRVVIEGRADEPLESVRVDDEDFTREIQQDHFRATVPRSRGSSFQVKARSRSGHETTKTVYAPR